MMLDQRELHLARIVGFADGPVAAAIFRRSILHHKAKKARRKDQVREGSTDSHSFSPGSNSTAVTGLAQALTATQAGTP
jgi:hypothetical protein